MTKRPTGPTRPILAVDPDWPAALGEDAVRRILDHVADSARPVLLDELVLLFPESGEAMGGLLANLEDEGLVEVMEREGIGKVVAITPAGRTLRHRI